DVLSKATSTVVEGEVMQLLTSDDLETPEEDYFNVMRAKTSALFAAACEVSAVLGKCSAEQRQALKDYGIYLGITFQLVDDLLDYDSDATTLGKNTGDDFREGKLTLPVVLAYRAGDKQEKTFWKRTMDDMEQNEGDFETALQLLKAHHIFPQVQEKARFYAQKASDALVVFPETEIKSILQSLPFYCLERRS
ncbi:MAG: polyprenyl synthetase family protein, partial [Gammaproteobacteria bacterium]|nr:polyprenyl synthetase family protein [Gammaproteobacteria bacterium]